MLRFAIHLVMFFSVLCVHIFSSGLLGHLTAAINASDAWGSLDARLTFAAGSVAPFFCSWLLHEIWQQMPSEWAYVEYERRAVEEEKRAERRRKLRA